VRRSSRSSSTAASSFFVCHMRKVLTTTPEEACWGLELLRLPQERPPVRKGRLRRRGRTLCALSRGGGPLCCAAPGACMPRACRRWCTRTQHWMQKSESVEIT
jgi:hypothetical protein